MVPVTMSMLRALEVESVDCVTVGIGVKQRRYRKAHDDIPEPHSGQRRFFSRVRFIQRSS